jgi:ABC-type dipeptide/oligopeptide/nickel transport system permease component
MRSGTRSRLALHLILRRLGLLLPVLIAALILTFVLTRVTHTDPLARVRSPYLTTEQVQALRDEYHFNDSIPEQFFYYVADAVRGDFGTSFTTARPVSRDLADGLPATLELVFVGILIAVVLGGAIGLLGALRPGGMLDGIGRTFVLIFVAIPVFWLSLLLLFLFYLELGWLPGPGSAAGEFGTGPPSVTGAPIIDGLIALDGRATWLAIKGVVLPGLALGLACAPFFARVVRQAFATVLDSDFIACARGLGLRPRTVLFRHAAPAAAPPILTALGTLVGFAIGGNLIVEIIFAWPGIGAYAYNAILASDFPAIEGFVLLVTLLYVLVFLVVDVTVAWIDPTAETAGHPG